MADKVAAARRAIYDLAKSIHSTAVEDLLKSFSGVPTVGKFTKTHASATYVPFSECLCESLGI